MISRRRLAALAAFPVASAPQRSTAQEDSTPAPRCICPQLDEREGVIVLNGTGSRLSEGFDLENGRYRVEIEMAYSDGPDYIAISLHYPDGNYDLLYNESDGEVFASAMARNRERGECFLEVGTSTVEWKVGISPL